MLLAIYSVGTSCLWDLSGDFLPSCGLHLKHEWTEGSKSLICLHGKSFSISARGRKENFAVPLVDNNAWCCRMIFGILIFCSRYTNNALTSRTVDVWPSWIRSSVSVWFKVYQLLSLVAFRTNALEKEKTYLSDRQWFKITFFLCFCQRLRQIINKWN